MSEYLDLHAPTRGEQVFSTPPMQRSDWSDCYNHSTKSVGQQNLFSLRLCSQTVSPFLQLPNRR